MNTCPCKPCTRIREINAQIDARIETDRATDRCECGEDTIIGCGSRPDRCCGLNADEDTITITISREDGEWWHKNYEPAAYPSGGPWEAIRRVDAAIRAALQGER